MEITEAIVHQIIKTQHSTNISINRRNNLFESNNTRLQELADGVRKAFNNTASIGYGSFRSDLTAIFPDQLRNYYSETQNMIAFSNNVIEILVEQMRTATASTGGYSFFVRYTENDNDFLMIAMLKTTDKVEFDDNLNLISVISVDIRLLHEVARINLTKWRDGTTPYLTFINKKGEQGDVSKYFRNALSCHEYTDSKTYTFNLKEAMESFANAQNYSRERKICIYQNVYDYFDRVDKEQGTANLQIIAQHVSEDNPEIFIDFLHSEQYLVADGFKPHKTTFRKWAVISFKGSYAGEPFGIDFPISLLNDKIIVNENNQSIESITLLDLPDSLKNKIREARS